MPVTCAALHLLFHISAPASVSPLPSQQPASTSLLLGQRLSKGIILLFSTPLFLHPSVFFFLVLAHWRVRFASVRSRSQQGSLTLLKMSHLHRCHRTSSLTPSPTQNQFPPQTTTMCTPWDVASPTCGDSPRSCDISQISSHLVGI